MEDKTPKGNNNAAATKTARLRSPSYPAINLETAISRAKIFYAEERRNATNVSVAVQHWDFKPKSSGGMVSIAALKSFGLIEEEGSGYKRKVKLSDSGLRIILDEREESPERDAEIKRAALRPKIHAQLWKKHGLDLPSDSNLRHALIFDRKFNENVADEVIKEYKDTIRFAKLTASDTLSVDPEDKNGSDEEREEAKVQEQQLPQQHTRQDMPPLSKAPAGRTPVGSEIPVASDCVMGVSALGRVTQGGIEKLISYLQLIKGSFPANGEGQ